MRVLDGQLDQEQVVDDGKAEDGGIEERNKEQAGSAEDTGERDNLLLPTGRTLWQRKNLREVGSSLTKGGRGEG